MKLTVKLFAAAKDIVGAPQIVVEVSDAADVAELKRSMQNQWSSLNELLARSHVAVDQKYAVATTILSAEQEIALIPPVSGG